MSGSTALKIRAIFLLALVLAFGAGAGLAQDNQAKQSPPIKFST